MPTATNVDAGFVPPRELEEAWHRHGEIVKLGDPILRTVATPVARISGDVRRLVTRMARILKEANGLGLAAPQVGVSARVIMYDMGDGLRVLVNPQIIGTAGDQDDPPEGCLSIPGLQGKVKRANEVRVKAFDERGRQFHRRATELEARVIQHEIDHLDGILFIDRADPATIEWVFGPGEDGDGNEAPRE